MLHGIKNIHGSNIRKVRTRPIVLYADIFHCPLPLNLPSLLFLVLRTGKKPYIKTVGLQCIPDQSIT